MSRSSNLLVVAALALTSACATRVGPKTIPGARFNYNETITRSLNEQLLLNLVRVRYRDTPLFVDVGSVIAQYEWAGSVGASPTIQIDGSENNEYGFGVGGSYSESPTISYEPVRGAAAAQRLLAPIDPSTLALLSQSGWSIERLMLCCVQEINGVENAPSATGPAPTSLPDNRDFRNLAALFRKLQSEGRIRARAFLEEDRPGVHLVLRDDPQNADLQELRRRLNLAPDRTDYQITSRTPDGSHVALSGRSLLGVLFFLSLTVEPPAAHIQQGLVGGASLDWSEVTGNLLEVKSSTDAPANAFVRIRYRGHWFYIEDRDLNSKATFNLLTYLYSLQAAGSQGGSPLLTVPVG